MEDSDIASCDSELACDAESLARNTERESSNVELMVTGSEVVRLSCRIVREDDDDSPPEAECEADHVEIEPHDMFVTRPPTIGAYGARNTTSMYPRTDV